jgi:hypothetical protein
VLAGVEVLGGYTHPRDPHVIWKDSVERALELFRLPALWHAEADDLAQGVDARVGSAGGVGYHAFAGQPLERGLELTLDRALGRLDLPARKVTAVVLKNRIERVSGHAERRLVAALASGKQHNGLRDLTKAAKPR